MSLWWRWKHSSWAPVNCPQRFATEYNFRCDEGSTEDSVLGSDEFRKIPFTHSRKRASTKLASSIRYKIHTCAACMKPLKEPHTLPCGHTFCKRCLANLRLILEDEYKETIQDPRALLRCPLGTCKNRKLCLSCPGVIPCLPLVNGEFRFKEVRQEDKVQLEASEVASEDYYDYDDFSPMEHELAHLRETM